MRIANFFKLKKIYYHLIKNNTLSNECHSYFSLGCNAFEG